MAEKNVKCEIVKHYGVICKKKSYQKEVNLISWNGREPVLDIRNFRISPDGERCPSGRNYCRERGYGGIERPAESH